MVGAILRGRAGAPCACFGARSTVGWTSVARNAAGRRFAALPLLPGGDLSTDEWLGLGLGVALAASPVSGSRSSRWPARSGCCGFGLARLGAGDLGRGARGGPRRPLSRASPAHTETRRSPSSPRPAVTSATAGAGDRQPAARTRSGRGLRGERNDADVWESSRSPAAPTRSRSTSRAGCSPREPSTTSPSSRASSPASAGGPTSRRGD